jgi:hypothetical protein
LADAPGARERAAGVVITMRGRPFAVMAFTATGGRIAEIDAIADPFCRRQIRRGAVAELTVSCRCGRASWPVDLPCHAAIKPVTAR